MKSIEEDYWMRMQRLEKEAREKCRLIAEKYFPKDKYKVTNIWPSLTPNGKITCTINFKRKTYEPPIECDELCNRYIPWGEAERYDECVDECEENLRVMTVNSVEVDPETLTVKSSTVIGGCHPIVQTPEEEYEEFEERQSKFYESFEKIGCTLKEGWIHPHELARGAIGYEVEMEEPASCFCHPKTMNGKCKLPDVLKLIEEWV